MTDPEETPPEEIIREIAQTHMPFGRYGPEKYPPDGVPIYDLPLDYLSWFEMREFPKGKLGRLMKIVYEIKAAGCDRVFDEVRARRGGRTLLRKKPPREWRFE